MLQIPFDVSYHFDAQLRDVPNDPAQMRQAVAWLRDQVAAETADARRRAQLLGALGIYSRTLGDLTAAREALTEALAISNALSDERLAIVMQIRLAHVYQWQRQYDLSDAMFAQVIERCETRPQLASYLDFAHQHAGKNKYDQGAYAEA